MGGQHEYVPLAEDKRSADGSFVNEPLDSPEPSTYGPHRRYGKMHRALCIGAVGLAVFTAGLVVGICLPSGVRASLWSATQPTARPSAVSWKVIQGVRTEGTQCGASWQEARALGCHFDVMASRWYSDECFDGGVLETMLAEPQVNITWYADREHTAVVPREKVLAGEFEKVYPDGMYHIQHCLYLWRRLHHAVVKNKPIDEDLLAYGHTMHCTRMIMKWMDPAFERNSISTATSGTPFCRRNPLGMLNVKGSAE